MKKMTVYYVTEEYPKEDKPTSSNILGKVRFSDNPDHYYGKDPDYCCEEMKWAYQHGNIGAHSWDLVLNINANYGPHPNPVIKYCPFCAAEIEFVQVAKVQAIKKQHMTDYWSYEEIK
jgi:hypothetical protein